MIVFEIPEPGNGRTNMEADIRSAMECLEGREEPLVRLYGWNPAAISLGAHQSSDLIDAGLARLHGVDVVSRPTGGGAILHTDELTYCVTLPAGQMAPTAIYAVITRALMAGLRLLGIEPDGSEVSEADSADGRYTPEPVCFSGFARHEVRVSKRKLIGSAQRVYRGDGGRTVILQHGSIVLSDAHSLLPIYFAGRDPDVTRRAIEQLRRRATSLSEEMGRRPDTQEVITAFRTGFSTLLEAHLSGPSNAVPELKEVLS